MQTQWGNIRSVISERRKQKSGCTNIAGTPVGVSRRAAFTTPNRHGSKSSNIQTLLGKRKLFFVFVLRAGGLHPLPRVLRYCVRSHHNNPDKEIRLHACWRPCVSAQKEMFASATSFDPVCRGNLSSFAKLRPRCKV